MVKSQIVCNAIAVKVHKQTQFLFSEWSDENSFVCPPEGTMPHFPLLAHCRSPACRQVKLPILEVNLDPEHSSMQL